MNELLQKRLDRIETVITQPDFLTSKGLGNEVAYYIFDYPPANEPEVRQHIAYLLAKYNTGKYSFQIAEFNLYEMILAILRERGYLEKCYAFEENKGLPYTLNAIIKMLRLTSEDNLLVEHIAAHAAENTVVFLTGVGNCYPIVRSHNVLNNLHLKLDTVPVVMFYPGEYSGQSLRLFGTMKDDNYYRAFRLC